MRIVIPGGTGQVGTLLARAFHADGHDVTVLSRREASTSIPWRVVPWDARTLGAWTNELEGADVVINLAGRSVNCRYTPANRAQILESRVQSADVIGRAIARCSAAPPIWLQASTATIYSHRFDAPNDDIDGIVGGHEVDAPASWRFSIDVARAWEAAAVNANPPATRLVLLRSAMVMSPDSGGIFATLHRLAHLGLGGPVDGGQQYVSWIHRDDFIRATYFLIGHAELSGAVNIASPLPLPYREFMRDIRREAHVSIGLPATRWMLEIGTRLLGTESELVLKSRRVVPRRLLSAGFEFRYADWPSAVADLISNPH